jgi:sulfoxide reductase heme-binding subunit YedZ
MIVPWRDRRGQFLPLKAAAFVAAFLPAIWYSYWWIAGDAGPRPVTEAIYGTGLWAIRFFSISLAITPIARMLQWPGLLLVRRMVGLTGLAYALAHLFFYTMDQKFVLGTVVFEILTRFYLTIGFVALLGFSALGVTSTNGMIKRMGRWWKRLHYLTYLLIAMGVFHYFIQSKANVSEPVFVAGLYAWLMLWRTLPMGWQRGVGVYPAQAVVAGLATAGIEFAWYGLATHIDPWRVLAVSEGLDFGLRPAHYVFIAGMVVVVLVLGRRIAGRFSRPSVRVAAQTT